jgi:glycosyltransferase involved in cell wall biosynthesis
VIVRVTIVSRIFRPEPSAASFFLGTVADRLAARGHDVLVLTARPSHGGSRGAHAGVRVKTFPVLRDRNGYVRGYLPYLSFDVPLFFRLLVSRRADVMLLEPPPTTAAVVRVVCALRRIPYVYDAADIWSDAADLATSSGLVVRVLRALERFGMRGASRLVTISQGVVERVRALGVDRPITVTGFGADTVAFSYRELPREPVFVYAGSYSTWHGAEILVDALARLRADGADATLRFIGIGERDVVLDRAAQLGVESSVECLASMSPADLVPHLASATASLATLRPGTGYEYAFTSKAYSSLAVGCPVIFAGPGPTGPFLLDASTHVRAGAPVEYDADAIAAAMRRMLTDPASGAERAALAQWTSREASMINVADRVSAVVEDAGKRRR